MAAGCRILLEPPMSVNFPAWRTYLGLFGITCILEGPIYWAFFRSLLSTKRILQAILLLNLATHPLVTWGYPWIFMSRKFLVRDYLLAAEFSAIAIEALLLMTIFKTGKGRALLSSFAANLFSWWTALYLLGGLGL